jgi:hypothetical protein
MIPQQPAEPYVADAPPVRRGVRHEDMKCMILKLVPAIVVILVLGGCAQEPVDIKYFTRQFNVSLPSASGFTAVRDSSDAHGDYKFILTFSADHNDISNLLVRVPEVMGGNWTVLTNSKTYSVGGSAFRSQPGALYIDGEGSGRFRSVAIDTNRNQVYFLHSTW